jgi:hypothetical protein
VGWGEKRTKTPEQIDLERRRALGQKYFTDISELIAIAGASKVKITRVATVAQDDDIFDQAPEVVGPAQLHVQYFKNRRAAKAAGMGTVGHCAAVSVPVQDEEPHVPDWKSRRSRGPAKGKTTKVKS